MATASPWVSDWAWGLPLLILTIVAHVCAIVLTASALAKYRGLSAGEAWRFVVYVALAALASSAFIALEAGMWALLYLSVGALPAWRAAMLYSLSAITSYGHAPILLEDRWQMLGAIEAVNGAILFGLTTAFLFAAIQTVWPLPRDAHETL
jgi:hypothetical protein